VSAPRGGIRVLFRAARNRSGFRFTWIHASGCPWGVITLATGIDALARFGRTLADPLR
jgi:hypothetical protein